MAMIRKNPILQRHPIMANVIRKKIPKFKKEKNISLRDFWEKRNQILIKRDVYAIGDYFMHRMLFEDIKKLNSELIIHFACQPKYFDCLKDHLYLDKLVDCNTVDSADYVVDYDTSTACTRYEDALGPLAIMHRSDIWANHCGFELQSHNMHIKISPESAAMASQTLANFKQEGKPIVLFCPHSANRDKDISTDQIRFLANYLKEKNCVVFSMNHFEPPLLRELNIPVLTNLAHTDLVALVHAADYVVTVDTAFYHIAGGLGKPLLGIFGYIDGKVYGKYYQSEFIQKHRDNGDWDCGPCGYHHGRCPKPMTHPFLQRCLTDITPEMICDGVDRMFKRWTWYSEKKL